jgi:hypothetical protein
MLQNGAILQMFILRNLGLRQKNAEKVSRPMPTTVWDTKQKKRPDGRPSDVPHYYPREIVTHITNILKNKCESVISGGPTLCKTAKAGVPKS